MTETNMRIDPKNVANTKAGWYNMRVKEKINPQSVVTAPVIMPAKTRWMKGSQSTGLLALPEEKYATDYSNYKQLPLNTQEISAEKQRYLKKGSQSHMQGSSLVLKGKLTNKDIFPGGAKAPPKEWCKAKISSIQLM